MSGPASEATGRTAGATATATAAAAVTAAAQLAAEGPVRALRRSAIERRAAENLARTWATVPQVTHFEHADVTELEALRARLATERPGGRTTILPWIVWCCARALAEHPRANAVLDGEQLLLPGFCNIGVAVRTDLGLVVPVVRRAERLSVPQLAAELARLIERARARRLAPAEMRGGTFTVSSLGGFGGAAFTPIVHSPQVAILGATRVRTEPRWRSGRFEPRAILPLSVTYDHRALDGADAALFARGVADLLERVGQEPQLALEQPAWPAGEAGPTGGGAGA
ncbi:MAG TPA: 2-oxo acid dehydrogenase subunit E2 [Solirubrobacteraceae bacterium]|nr:2-oxo acid dehydrogenase subunit E2 [Solirubrobacteraceae bacterium]